MLSQKLELVTFPGTNKEAYLLPCRFSKAKVYCQYDTARSDEALNFRRSVG